MHIPAKVDYGMRALLILATRDTPTTGQALAEEQGIPTKFLGTILTELHRGGLVGSQRGTQGGYYLARPASEITVADVIRVLEGPLAEVRGLRPEMTAYKGAAEHLQTVWVAVRGSLRRVLDLVTLEDVVLGRLPDSVSQLIDEPDAWNARLRR
jgi:Rrf2 family protein